MISFDEDSFIYKHYILVRDTSGYADLSAFIPDLKKKQKEEESKSILDTLISGGDEADTTIGSMFDVFLDDGPISGGAKKESTGLSIDELSEIESSASKPDTHASTSSSSSSSEHEHKPNPAEINFVPSKTDDALIDVPRPLTAEDEMLKKQVTISNQQVMLDAVPIWRMKSNDYTNILHDFEHYKDAVFAVAFRDSIPEDLEELSVDKILSSHTIDADSIRKFKISYIDIPTEDPYDIPDAQPTSSDDASSKPTSSDDASSTDTSSISGGAAKKVPTRKIPLITFTNLCLFKTTTLLELKQILAFQLKMNVSNIIPRIRDVHSIIYPYSQVVTNSKYKWVHNMQSQASEREAKYTQTEKSLFTLSEPQPQKTFKSSNPAFRNQQNLADGSILAISDLTNKTVSIGSNPIIISIVKNTDSRTNIYEELFYPNYLTTATYYKNVINHAKKLNLSKTPFTLNISQVTVQLIYKGPAASHSNLNIVKLFNMNHVSEKCSKIYIQSKILDDYKRNERQKQYVKVFRNSANQFKGVDAQYNTCSFYMSEQIFERNTNVNTGILMHHLDVSENMNVSFVFTNTNMKNTYEHILDMATQYIATSAESILRKIKLNEAIYNTEYRYCYYVPVITNITASFTIASSTMEDLQGTSAIMHQEIPQLKFATRSSMYFSAYSFYSLSYWYRMMYLQNAHEFLTTGIIYKDIFPTIHCIHNDETKEMTVTLGNMSTYDNLVYSASLIIGSVKKPTSHFLLEDIGITDDHEGKVDVNAIRKMALKYDKKLLKLLTRIDPTLFGPRYIGTKNRSYSGLCQKREQRPIPITEHEYEELMKDPSLRQSLTKLQNQTYPEQTICLFCADKEYKFLNYHHFPNQTCIVRCTSKSSNKTQYEHCVKSLNAQNRIDIQNRYENQTITLYNTLITRGRKCRVPDEIKDVLTSYVLIKLNVNHGRIDSYCMETWAKHAFIIQREMTRHGDMFVCDRYRIKTDYSTDFDYVLILESEGDDSYFAFITEGNNPKPLMFSQNDDIREFFVTHVKQTNDNNDFLRFLEKALNTNLGDYTLKSMKEIIKSLRIDVGLRYIVEENYIYGVIKGNVVYLTPPLYWYFEEGGIGNTDFKSVGRSLKMSKTEAEKNSFEKLYGPDVTTLQFKYIKAIYVDYGSQLVRMINYDGNHILVEPFEITSKYANIDMIQFDYYAFLDQLINTGKPDVSITGKDDDIQKFEIGNVINTYIYIYLMNHDSINKRDFYRYMAEIGAITFKDTYTNYCDKQSKNFISWRNSKIKRDMFLEYMNKYITFNINDLISTNYRMLNMEMDFRVVGNEEIKSKIITS